MLVASVTCPDEIEKAQSFADIVELRLDSFQIDQKPPCPCIFTLRRKEGFSEKERLAQIETLLALQPEYCDLEADTDPVFIGRIAKKFPNVKLIGSYHNFQETPKDLEFLLENMKNPHFAIYKIAVTAQSTIDMLRLMIFARKAKVPLTAISMGEYGKPSRVLGPVVGNIFDYAGLEEDPTLHRFSLQTLHEVFHYRKLNRDTQIYALIGDPVEQSSSHLFHNPRFLHNAVYIKMRLPAEQLSECFKLIRQLPFGGLSVTIPLKEAIFPYMDEVKPIARSIGAINTVIFHSQKAIGTNTDGLGALHAMEKHIPVRGKHLAILGAGGTARAIAYEAKQRGAIVSIYNRTPERAKRLAAEFGCSGDGLDALHTYEILVNTIPKSPFIPTFLPKTVVMDVVRHPRESPLLAAAKKHGCICICSEEMFVEQALLQQIEWK